mmetsp:Transcript_14093/g.41443  ORF Transcript_14093/g.41443 Transcript_14093/m.41443 type:complete len:125 (-) Transcript_14093:1325-1699(-)
MWWLCAGCRRPEDDLKAAAALMAAAFVENPTYGYMFQSVPVDRFQAALGWLFLRNLRIRHGLGGAWGGYVGDRLVCTFVLEPSSRRVPRALRSGRWCARGCSLRLYCSEWDLWCGSSKPWSTSK